MSGTIRFAIGAAILSHLLLALLWLGWAAPWLMAGLFLVGLAGLCYLLISRLPEVSWQLADLVFLPFGLLYLVHTLAPETTSDAIAYHLGLPAEWLRAGGFTGRSGFFETIPHGLETLFAAAIPVGGYTAAKLVHFAFFAATVPLMIEVARGFGFDGRPAALLYFASPVTAMAGTAAYNDAALSFYTLAAFSLLVRADAERYEGSAGLAAGFCYAIKLSGGVTTLAAAVVLAWRRSWLGLAAIAFIVAPWLAHSWWLSENPVAPLLLSWFPSPAFHPITVAGWTDYVRSYGTSWAGGERLREVLITGVRTQGLLGAGFLLTPLALVPVFLRGPQRRRRTTLLLTLAALISGSAWLLNAGTRFLMPASVFAALAIAGWLPVRLAWTIALLHGALSWPDVLDRTVPADAWRLPSTLPWRAALRLESEAEYLRRMSPPFLVAEMVNRYVPPTARVLDFAETPRAYAQAELVSSWQHAPGARAAAALVTAHSSDRHVLYSLRGVWPLVRLRSLRFTQYSSSPDVWSILEARLRRKGETLFPSQKWDLIASPNPSDAPLAFDRNPISAWRAWQPRRDGMYLEIRAEEGVETDGVELVLPRNEAGPRVEASGIDWAGQAVMLAERLAPAEAVRLNHRLDAMRYLRREGFTWILAAPGDDGLNAVCRALVNDARDWDLQPVAAAGGVQLLRIVPAAR